MNRRGFIKTGLTVIGGIAFAPALKAVQPLDLVASPISGGYLVPEEFTRNIVAHTYDVDRRAYSLLTTISQGSPGLLDTFGIRSNRRAFAIWLTDE